MYEATVTFTTLVEGQDREDAFNILASEIYDMYPGVVLDIRLSEIND